MHFSFVRFTFAASHLTLIVKIIVPKTSWTHPLAGVATLALLPLTGLAAESAAEPATDSSRWSRWFNDPPQIKAGPFDIHPRLTLSTLFDDNILISSTNPESDLIWSVYPAALILAGDRKSMAEYRLNGQNPLSLSPASFITQPSDTWPGSLLAVDYGPRFNWFTYNSKNNSVDQLAALNTLLPFGRAIVGVNQTYNLINTTVIVAGARTEQTTYNTALTSGFQTGSRSSVEVNLRRSSLSYAAEGLVGNQQYSNDNWFHWQTSDLLNIGAGVTLGYVNVPAQGLRPQTSQTYQQVLGRAIYRVAERVDVDGAVGVEFRQYSTGASGTVEPVFSFTGSYRPGIATSFSLNAHRWDQPSTGGGDNYLQTGFNLGASQQLFDRLNVSVSGGYDNYHYYSYQRVSLRQNPDSNYLSAGAGVSIRFNPCLGANAFYRYSQQTGNANNGFTDNQVGLQVTYSF